MGGNVHVDWYIISFTIPFGAEPSGPEPLGWSDFAAMLPQNDSNTAETTRAAAPTGDVSLTNVIRLIPAAGLVRTAADGTWQVRADTFAFAVQTAFPLTEADLCGSGAPTLYTPPATEPPYYVAIRPMDIAGVTSVMDITVTDTSVPPGTGVLNIGTQWNWTANLAGVPAAMWSAPDGSTNLTTPSADTLPNRLMGINGLSPQATQPAGPAPIPIANCLMARTRYWSRSRCRCCW